MAGGVRAALLRGVRESIRNNGQAYGFSLSVTGSFGILGTRDERPTIVEVLLFGLGAAAAVGILEVSATRGFRVPLEHESSVVTALGVSLGFFSVALSIGATWSLSLLLARPAVWPAAGAVSAAVYVIFAGLQLAIARSARRTAGAEDAEDQAP